MSRRSSSGRSALRRVISDDFTSSSHSPRHASYFGPVRAGRRQRASRRLFATPQSQREESHLQATASPQPLRPSQGSRPRALRRARPLARGWGGRRHRGAASPGAGHPSGGRRSPTSSSRRPGAACPIRTKPVARAERGLLWSPDRYERPDCPRAPATASPQGRPAQRRRCLRARHAPCRCRPSATPSNRADGHREHPLARSSRLTDQQRLEVASPSGRAPLCTAARIPHRGRPQLLR